MQISIDQMTTIVSTMPLKFLQDNKKRQKFNLYFHIVLKMNGAKIDEEKRARLKKYIVGYIQATGGIVQAIGFARNRLHILAGLPQTRFSANFVSELKLVSKTFARRRLGAEKFDWCEEYDVFTVSLSHIDRVRNNIQKQTKSFCKIISEKNNGK